MFIAFLWNARNTVLPPLALAKIRVDLGVIAERRELSEGSAEFVHSHISAHHLVHLHEILENPTWSIAHEATVQEILAEVYLDNSDMYGSGHSESDAIVALILGEDGLDAVQESFQAMADATAPVVEAVQAMGNAINDVGRAFGSAVANVLLPDWIAEGQWVRNKLTQKVGKISAVRLRDIEVERWVIGDVLENHPQRYSKKSVLDLLEPCNDPVTRHSRWALLD